MFSKETTWVLQLLYSVLASPPLSSRAYFKGMPWIFRGSLKGFPLRAFRVLGFSLVLGASQRAPKPLN